MAKLELRQFTELPKPRTKLSYGTERQLGSDARDAILVARQAADLGNYVNVFNVIHRIAHDRGAFICGCCLRELHSGYTSRSEAWGFGYFILCDGCFIYFFGQSVYDYRLWLLREDTRKRRLA